MKKLALTIASTALLAVSAASFAAVSIPANTAHMSGKQKSVYIKNTTGETIHIMSGGKEVTYLPSWDGYWMGNYSAGTYVFQTEGGSVQKIGEFVIMNKTLTPEEIRPIIAGYSVTQDNSAYSDHPSIVAIDISKS